MVLALLAGPLAARAEEAKKVPRIGFLSTGWPLQPGNSPLNDAFRQGLREFGYVEGQNIAIEWRYAQERPERVPEVAAELVRLRVDVIVAPINPAVLAAQRATRTIPIVMMVSVDPVGLGFVASLARPGGNITGLTSQAPDLAGKRLQLLREAVPKLSRLAILWDPTEPSLRPNVREMEVAAPALGVQRQLVEARGPASERGHPVIGRRALIAGVVLGAPSAHAQGAAKIARVGWLSHAVSTAGASNLDALRAGLKERGYVEGANLTIETRWADGNTARLPGLAAELVRLKVDVICAAGSPATLAAKNATTTIPIVFAAVAFPDQQGLVASYARPGGNVTGVSFIGPEYGKRLEVLKAAAPKLHRVALIYNPDNPGSVLALEETKRWAQALGVAIEPHGVRGVGDFASVFEAIAKKPPHALMTTADVLIASYRPRIVGFAAKNRLLSMYPDKEYVEAGGLMFYGGSIPDMYRRAALYVDRILKGAHPNDLPVEQPTKFDMVINLRTARALGLTIPPALLLRATELIQ